MVKLIKQSIDFIGNVLGVICALLFFAEIFYHTTNDYYSIAGKFRDLSLFGWGMMFLLWGMALYYCRKSQYALLQFAVWLTVICFVLDCYRFLVYVGDENCKFYLEIVMVAEVATLLVAIYCRYYILSVYSSAALLITYFGVFWIYSSAYYISEYLIYAFLCAGVVLWVAIQLCYLYQWQKGLYLFKGLLWGSAVVFLFTIVTILYQHLSFGIRFYERPITEAVKNPKVSVIVPVYNAEDTIERALDSLRKQTLRDIEIITVDDGSTDDTGKILDKYAAFDKRIKVIHQKNAYIGAARNRGMKEATGEYIGFIDNDDWVSLNYYEELYKAAKKDDAEVAYVSQIWQVFQQFPEIKELSETLVDRSGIAPVKTKIGSTMIWNKIYKSDFLRQYHILFTTYRTIYEDYYFSTQVAMYAQKIVFINNISYYYFRHKNSVTMSGQRSIDYEVFGMFSMMDEIVQNSGLNENEKPMWLQFVQALRHFIFHDNYSVLSENDKELYKQLIKEKYPDDNVDF